jgi:hypothetical protein
MELDPVIIAIFDLHSESINNACWEYSSAFHWPILITHRSSDLPILTHN